MRRRHVGLLAWFCLMLVVGTGRLVWSTVRAVVSRPRLLLTLVGLVVAMHTSPLLVRQLQLDQVRPLGHMIWSWGAPFLGAAVLFHGLRSRWLWQLRRKLWHRRR